MHIQESGENYLETILMLCRERGNVRSIDLANALGFSKPTISVTMKRFRQSGLVEIDEMGFITLTEEGRKIGEKMLERHEVLAHLFMHIGVNREIAYEDACKVEHHISDETFECTKGFLHQLEKIESIGNIENMENIEKMD